MLLFSACGPSGETNKLDKISSAESVWKNFPERLTSLFNELDLEKPELASVKKNLSKEDTIQAANELANYFRTVNREWVVTTRDPISIDAALKTAEQLLVDSIVIHEEKAKVPIVDGGWKWDFTGPSEDDEFGYSLNGQRYLMSLAVAWENSGDDIYINKFDQIIKDWVVNHPVPAADDSIYVVLDPTKRVDWRDIGEVEWRTLEAGQRLGATWPQVFYGLHKEETLSDAAILLMLSSIADQAKYLRQYHKSGHNWTTMEMNGLALAGLSFPEFKKSDDWANYALETMTTEINRQVYPDGTQTELSTKTQWVALRRFESIATNFQKADREISQAYMDRIEDMYNYLAYCMRPDGSQPLNSDSDREDLRERILIAADKFERPDWKYIATNGESGTLSRQKPSITFPWAGIHISRSGWDKNAQWSFFDFGAYGTGHQHRDKLHLSVSAYGKDLLVDGGRFTHEDYFSFDPTIWRGYFRSSFSHNVILVNGKGQNAGPTIASASLGEGVDYKYGPNYDYAYGTFTDGFEGVDANIIHSRSVLYVHNEFWIVIDNLTTDQSIDIQALWHYSPDFEIKIEGQDVFSTSESGPNLLIKPMGNFLWETEIIKGQEEPFKQGWYSENYGIKEPNSTAIFSSKLENSESFLWMLVPFEGQVPQVKTKTSNANGIYHLEITKDDKLIKLTIPTEKNLSLVNVTIIDQ
ncbi:MAG: alginate lyase family protein [Bacteroidota bacterium]